MAQPSNWYAVPGAEILWSDLALSSDDKDVVAITTPPKPSVLTPPPTPPAIPPPTEKPRNKTVPAQGTRIQRSDREQRPTPPTTPTPSIAAGEKPKGHTTRPTDQGTPNAHRPEPLRAIGPSLPPPIKEEVQPGLIAEIPHFAVHVSR
ncbi:extensin-like [Odontomachus brunneus]|uniref:extensin-like n=1 Tax=Odontomachus brunneus TaxID=486640 RepID=UPI0013F1BBE7|nr:extensin-like [Odontomachus brunneus]